MHSEGKGHYGSPFSSFPHSVSSAAIREKAGQNLLFVLDNHDQPLQLLLDRQQSSFANRLNHLCCHKNRKSFLTQDNNSAQHLPLTETLSSSCSDMLSVCVLLICTFVFVLSSCTFSTQSLYILLCCNLPHRFFIYFTPFALLLLNTMVRLSIADKCFAAATSDFHMSGMNTSFSFYQQQSNIWNNCNHCTLFHYISVTPSHWTTRWSKIWSICSNY